MSRRPLALAVAAAAAAIVLFVLLRPDDEDGEGAAAPPAATTTGERTDTVEAPPNPQPRKPAVVLIGINVRGGKPVGGIRRAAVKRGRRVRLVVRADVGDHVHLHGYDIMRDVRPGAPAVIRFRATIPGRFEAELEDRRLQILDLQVRP